MLLRKGSPFGRWTLMAAARNGHAEMVCFIRSEGYPMYGASCVQMAFHEHLHLLKALHEEEGLPLEEKAALGGAGGCPGPPG